MPDGFHAEGRFYPLNSALGNLQIDPATGIAIRGLLSGIGRPRRAHSGVTLNCAFDSKSCWPVAIVWGPKREDFLCLEPLAAVTNGINLHHRGLRPGLQWIEPGSAWKGGFAILNLHEST
jgi:aldose 1-epimerase